MALVVVVDSLDFDTGPMEFFYTNFVKLLVLLGVLFFAIMTCSLLGFHTYLACVNLTTCKRKTGEVLSWDRVSYLSKWPRELGSPFSRGCMANLRFYCIEKLPPEYIIWKMPVQRPEPSPNQSYG